MKRMLIRFLSFCLSGMLSLLPSMFIGKANILLTCSNTGATKQATTHSPEPESDEPIKRFPSAFGVQVQGEKNVRLLELGKPIEDQLAGGGTHTYLIVLTEGQYLNLVVEQKGVDVVVRVIDPNGQQLLEVDSPNGTQGPEPVHLVSGSTGNYQIRISSLEKDAPKGLYEIKILALRTASNHDKNRVAAEQALNEASILAGKETVDSIQNSITKLEDSVRLFRAAEEPNGEIRALNNIGNNYLDLGQAEKAHDFYQKAFALCQSISNCQYEITLLNNLGNSFDVTGNKQRALDTHSRVLELARSRGDQLNEARALTNLGRLYNHLGEPSTSLFFYNQALELWKKRHATEAVATVMDNMGVVYVDIGEYEKAIIYYKQALPITRDTGKRRVEGAIISNLGRLYYLTGEHQKALEYFEQALPIARSCGDMVLEANTLRFMGDIFIAIGDKERANEYFLHSLSIGRKIGDSTIESIAVAEIAQVEYDKGNLLEAKKQIELALKISESLRSSLTNYSVRTSFFATVQDYYDLYIDILMQLHRQYPAEAYNSLALEATESARARSLLEMLGESHTDIRQGVDSLMIDRERRLQQRIDEKKQARIELLQGKHTQEQVASIEEELKSLLAEDEQLRGQIRASSPRYAAITQPQPMKFKDIQKLLDADTLLLEYSLGNEHSFLWAVTSNALSSYELPPTKEIEAAATQLYNLMTARQPVRGETQKQYATRIAEADAKYEQQIAKLSQILLAPVAAQLGTKRLLIVPDGALQYVPFAALPVPVKNTQNGAGLKMPLIAAHEVINLPSASVLAVMRQETARRSLTTKHIAVVADPVFDKDDDRVQKNASPVSVTPQSDAAIGKRALRDAGLFGDGTAVPRLPFTRQEAEAITAMVPAASTLKAIGFKANLATVKSPELSHYRIVHFATHALINTDHPYLSGLLLSLVDEQGKPQDGFLSLNDIYNLNLPADLILLSACQTAKGKEMRGEGLIGLTRGFMYAGAQRVVASLWKVDDAATAELMKRFYRGMFKEGLRPAAALRTAQVEMSKQKLWNKPYYWAGFILQGEWK